LKTQIIKVLRNSSQGLTQVATRPLTAISTILIVLFAQGEKLYLSTKAKAIARTIKARKGSISPNCSSI